MTDCQALIGRLSSGSSDGHSIQLMKTVLFNIAVHKPAYASYDTYAEICIGKHSFDDDIGHQLGLDEITCFVLVALGVPPDLTNSPKACSTTLYGWFKAVDRIEITRL